MVMHPAKLLIFLLTLAMESATAAPDTVTNRYATEADSAYWPTVNPGDYIFFRGNIDDGADIYAPGGKKFPLITLPVRGKILIHQGNFERILINGEACLSTKENPTIVTNLGGQVRWGSSSDKNQYRSLELFNFAHLHLTGKHSPGSQTGHPDYRGHDGGDALNSGDYYEHYGLWGNPKWSGPIHYGKYGNGVRIHRFKTLKVDYVASWGGYFASFNIKTDNPSKPSEVDVDIQDCFAGFGEGEAFYISYSTKASNQDITRLTLKNNITVFTGAEALQTDNLAEGSVIENNVCLGSATFFRHPFQSRYQDNLHQLSFVEGNVNVRNNLLLGTNGALHQFRYRDPGNPSRVDPSVDKPVTIQNNFYGFSRTTIGYMWPGDGITPYLFKDNVYGDISVPNSDDTLRVPAPFEPGHFKIGNDNNPVTFEGNIFPAGRELYFPSRQGKGNITSINNRQQAAPPLLFRNSGFPDEIDWRSITFWAASYSNTPAQDGKSKDGRFIPYAKNDIVIFHDSEGITRFFKCLKAHAGNFDPNRSPSYWAPMTWNDRPLPPFDLRTQKGSYYEKRGMGLTYQ